MNKGRRQQRDQQQRDGCSVKDICLCFQMQKGIVSRSFSSMEQGYGSARSELKEGEYTGLLSIMNSVKWC